MTRGIRNARGKQWEQLLTIPPRYAQGSVKSGICGLLLQARACASPALGLFLKQGFTSHEDILRSIMSYGDKDAIASLILLPLPPKCWSYRSTSSHLVQSVQTKFHPPRNSVLPYVYSLGVEHRE